ncbi:MAG: copper resistance protein CopC [Filomicrobium sp.]
MHAKYMNGWVRQSKIVALILLIVVASSNAFAHSQMNDSVPADGATVAAGLSQIELKFTDDLRLTLAKISRAPEQDSGKLSITRIPKAFTSHVTLSVPPLEVGVYTVTWTGVGKDGHVMSGSFSFSVAAD